jgi:two-component system sensor histidine kinase/response regulator
VLTTAIRQGGKDLLHVVWTDITAQKQAEAELAEYRHDLERKVAERTAEVIAATESLRVAQEERQAVFDAASVGIVLTRDRVIVHCNRTMERMLGREAGELTGQLTRIWYRSDAEYAAAGERIYADVSRQGFHREEIELTRKDGSTFWARLTVQAFDRDRPEQGVAGTIEDITAERAAIAEMARARELAEDAARTKSDFLANMSHEIRTPMNAVIGMTHLVLKTGLTPRQREYVRKIQSSSQMLLGILNDILDFSKIDAGKLVVERIDFELDRVLDNVAAMVAERTAGKGLELIIDVAADVPNNLVGDPLRIGQILTNYANNAVKFTEHGEIAIRVEVEGRDGDEVRLRFWCATPASASKRQQRERLFRSFEQADTSITRKYGGTGLGLVISKRLAELMGGEVGVDSVPGDGSTFWFTVALGTGRDAGERFLPRADLRGRRVLVVDDNEHAREIIGDQLRAHDVRGRDGGVRRRCACGTAPCRGGARAPRDRLPRLAHARHGRARDGRRDPPARARSSPHLLMVTAYGRDDLVASASRVGIEDVLTKPVTPSQLFDAAMRVLGADESARHRPRADESGVRATCRRSRVPARCSSRTTISTRRSRPSSCTRSGSRSTSPPTAPSRSRS